MNIKKIEQHLRQQIHLSELDLNNEKKLLDKQNQKNVTLKEKSEKISKTACPLPNVAAA